MNVAPNLPNSYSPVRFVLYFIFKLAGAVRKKKLRTFIGIRAERTKVCLKTTLIKKIQRAMSGKVILMVSSFWHSHMVVEIAPYNGQFASFSYILMFYYWHRAIISHKIKLFWQISRTTVRMCERTNALQKIFATWATRFYSSYKFLMNSSPEYFSKSWTIRSLTSFRRVI